MEKLEDSMMTNLVNNEHSIGADSIEEKIEQQFAEKKWVDIVENLNSDSPDLASLTKKTLESYTSNIGLNFSEIQPIWGYRNADIASNLEQVDRLEAARPGITKSLIEIFGIKEFRRYPLEVLIKQYDQKDIDAPYGILLYTNNDHNGAFDQDSDAIFELSKQLDEGDMMLRIAEFDSSYGLIKRLAVFNSEYGDKEKISFLILGAHGSENGFLVGAHGDRVTKRNLDGQGVKRIKQYFVENPEIIFNSCSTGVEDGIAEAMAETYEARVLAPTIPTGIKSISFDKNKKEHFSVDYRRNPGYLGPSPLRVYKGKIPTLEEIAKEDAAWGDVNDLDL